MCGGTAPWAEPQPRFDTKALRTRFALATLLPGLLFGPPALAAKTLGEPGAELFTNGPVLQFHIEVSKVGMEWLRKDARKYVPAKVTEGTNVYPDVAVHLKGAAGSFRGVDDTPALTLHFGKFTPEQDFHQLHKIHLNNSVQDRSFSTEYICGGMMHAAGVPAPRRA